MSVDKKVADRASRVLPGSFSQSCETVRAQISARRVAKNDLNKEKQCKIINLLKIPITFVQMQLTKINILSTGITMKM